MSGGFPSRREDGSFAIGALFSWPDESLLMLLRAYLAAWLRSNKRWVRIWRSDVVKEEILDWYGDFSADPRAEPHDKPHHVVVVLEGRAESQRWKAWATRLVDEITKVFPEARFEQFVSWAPEPHEQPGDRQFKDGEP